ncbi:hypothetical protein OE766_18310 [Pararhizobium sp. YC-54]|uniref:hypothetical protein n=1 Tax=Pararhizobium sp. YC-54 TaxID=2986920 RepID=UPI0021F79651|nr:hypothetical protein [Pararhizobium sp. YC-54]MCW0000191.1 hypothetical protein [Pararhizobium sp. YC-54]
MRKIVFALVLASPMLAVSPAAAQSMKIEDLCVKVAKHLLMTETLHTGVVQSFPELKPPGARMTYSTRDGVEKKNMVDTFECQFDSAAAPYGLKRFCLASTCYSADEKNQENKRRFDEVRILMKREGF